MPLMPMPKEEFQMVMEVVEKPIWGRSIVGSADVPIAALTARCLAPLASMECFRSTGTR